MIRLAVDLELNQPSNSIISIGACAFNTETGELLDQFHEFVHTDEVLNPEIIKLTGIHQCDVDSAQDLGVVYQKLVGFKEKNKTHFMCCTWGAGDMPLLKDQVYKYAQANYLGRWDSSDWWQFGRTEMNVKNLHQALLESQGKSIQGGLKTSMRKWGVPFAGPAHNSLNDAQATAQFYCFLLQRLKTICQP